MENRCNLLIKNRIITALFIISALFAWNLPAGPAFAADGPPQGAEDLLQKLESPNIITGDGLLADYTDKTVVLQSNDVHGNIDGYQYMAGLRDELVKRGADVIVVDCGDYTQGSKYVSATKGANAIRMMSKVKYDVVTLGNHEFDYSYSRFREITSGVSFDIICDNIMNPDETPAFAGTKLVKGDVDVGFLGIDSPETQTKTSPSNLEGMTFLTDKTEPAIFDQARKDIADLKTDGAEVVLALTHLGVDEESKPFRSYDLWEAAKDSGLDYILDAHSHTAMTQGEGGEPIIQTGSSFANIGVITIDEKTGELDESAKPALYKITEDSYSSAEVKAEADKVNEEVNEIYNTKVGAAKVELNGYRDAQSAQAGGSYFNNGNRDGETNAGNFSTDALLWYALKDGKTYDVPEDHVLALYNGGSIRTGIKRGEITRGDVLDVYPFGNPIEAIYVKGSQLLEALEASTFSFPNANAGFPHVAGMEYTIDPWKKFVPADETYPASDYYPPASIQRVTIDSINGKPFSADDTYLVVTSSFIADGGDTYGAFRGLPKITIANLDEELFCDYIRQKLGGVIGGEYAEPKGRIHVAAGSGKADNPLQVTGKTATVKYKKLKKKAKVLKAGQVYDFTNPGEGVRTYKLISAAKGGKSFKKAFKVNASTGKVTVRKKTKKGTYNLTVRITAAGNDNYNAAEQTVTCRIKIRP